MRRLLWGAQSAMRTVSALMSTLGYQRLGALRPVALLLFALALLFAFLAAAPFLSPFVYPLF